MNWLVLALAGGFVGLDSTSFPQAMISRPLVAATLGGLIFGDPVTGAMLGVILEVLTFVVLPVGAARYPESGTAAAAAAAALVHTGASWADTPLLLMAALFALGWERVAGLTVVLGRKVNERFVADIPAATSAERAVVRAHMLALGFDWLRGAACVLVGALAGSLLLRLFGPLLQLDTNTAGGVIAVAATALAGAGLSLFGGWRERRVTFGIGILCGLLLILAA